MSLCFRILVNAPCVCCQPTLAASTGFAGHVDEVGIILCAAMAFLLRGHMPDPLKLLINVAGFIVSFQASLKTLAKVNLLMVSPELSQMYLATHLFQLAFIGLKKPTSHGCNTCVV